MSLKYLDWYFDIFEQGYSFSELLVNLALEK